jgi:hypothetical protein
VGCHRRYQPTGRPYHKAICAVSVAVQYVQNSTTTSVCQSMRCANFPIAAVRGSSWYISSCSHQNLRDNDLSFRVLFCSVLFCSVLTNLCAEGIRQGRVWPVTVVRSLAPSHPCHMLPCPLTTTSGERSDAKEGRLLGTPDGSPSIDHGRQGTAIPRASHRIAHCSVAIILALVCLIARTPP